MLIDICISTIYSSTVDAHRGNICATVMLYLVLTTHDILSDAVFIIIQAYSRHTIIMNMPGLMEMVCNMENLFLWERSLLNVHN